MNLLIQFRLGVHPDKEVHDIVVNAFGEWNFATRKIKRMLYWMPKLRYTNKYLDRREIENKKLDDAQLAKIALKMMCRDPGTTLTHVKVHLFIFFIDNYFFYYLFQVKQENSGNDSWIVSAQSPLQRRLISQLGEKPPTLYIDGPNLVYVMDKRVKYFILSAPPEQADFNEFVEHRDVYDMKDIRNKLFDEKADLCELNIHQQSDQTIFGLAVFEHNSESMSASWLNHLTENNPKLSDVKVLFRVRKDEIEFSTEDDDEEGQHKRKKGSKSSFKLY